MADAKCFRVRWGKTRRANPPSVGSPDPRVAAAVDAPARNPVATSVQSGSTTGTRAHCGAATATRRRHSVFSCWPMSKRIVRCAPSNARGSTRRGRAVSARRPMPTNSRRWLRSLVAHPMHPSACLAESMSTRHPDRSRMWVSSGGLDSLPTAAAHPGLANIRGVV